MNGSYFPYIGFAAAKIEVRALRVATIPPLAILADCCSITSCNALLSSGFILSNSSILTNPWSPSTTAPASNIIIPVLSRTTAAVNPAAVEPLPEVYKPRGAILAQNFNISLFAVPGSPTKNTLMSPLILLPSPNNLWFEPTISNKIASLISDWPWIWGANESISLWYMSGIWPSDLIIFSSSGEISSLATFLSDLIPRPAKNSILFPSILNRYNPLWPRCIPATDSCSILTTPVRIIRSPGRELSTKSCLIVTSI